jgi:hypothetical protein
MFKSTSAHTGHSLSRPRRLGPFFFVRSRPFREARIRAYIVRQHRAGRRLSDILGDRQLERLGSRTLIWNVVCQPQTIAALTADVASEFDSSRAGLDLAAGARTPPH